MNRAEVSRATLGRVPMYLKYLKDKNDPGGNISATALAKELGLGDVQVRKDLAAVSGDGRPKTGYNIGRLTAALEGFLVGGDKTKVVLVGAGKLGSALLDYGGFDEYGLEISAAFDIDAPAKKSVKPVYDISELEGFCRKENIKIGIIAVPASAAENVCRRMINAGIRGILCFAPCRLEVPEGVSVKYENMALSLAHLSRTI